jgi:hypothetical protein
MSDVLQHAEAFIQLRTEIAVLLSENISSEFDTNQVIGHDEAAEAIILFFAGKAAQ